MDSESEAESYPGVLLLSLFSASNGQTRKSDGENEISSPRIYFIRSLGSVFLFLTPYSRRLSHSLRKMVPDGVKGGNIPKAMVSLAVSLGQLSTRNPGSQDDGRRERQPKEQEIRSFYKRCQAKRCPGLADSLTPHGMNFWQEFA